MFVLAPSVRFVTGSRQTIKRGDQVINQVTGDQVRPVPPVTRGRHPRPKPMAAVLVHGTDFALFGRDCPHHDFWPRWI